MEKVESLEQAAREVASDFCYKVHVWRGFSPEFMQAQVGRLTEAIEKVLAERERLVWAEAAKLMCSCCRLDGDPQDWINREHVECDRFQHSYDDGDTIPCEAQAIWQFRARGEQVK